MPLPEQRAIAAILDSADADIQATDALIGKLRRERDGLLHDLLTRGVDESGALRDPDAHPEQFKDSELGRIPVGWKVVTLKNVCSYITDGTHEGATPIEQTSDSVPFLYVSCIRDGKIYWDKAAYISREIYNRISVGREPHINTILYTVVGSYGHAALVDNLVEFSFQRHIAYLLPDETKIAPRFLMAWLNSPTARQRADKIAIGNAQKTITLGGLFAFPVLLPTDKSEQQLVVDVLSVHNDRIDLEESRRDKLRAIKAGLMDDLLTGRVRVHDLEGWTHDSQA